MLEVANAIGKYNFLSEGMQLSPDLLAEAKEAIETITKKSELSPIFGWLSDHVDPLKDADLTDTKWIGYLNDLPKLSLAFAFQWCVNES